MTRIAGIDVGGTFTDLVLVDEATGEVRLAKVPTTADNQAFGVLAALGQTPTLDPAEAEAVIAAVGTGVAWSVGLICAADVVTGWAKAVRARPGSLQAQPRCRRDAP